MDENLDGAIANYMAISGFHKVPKFLTVFGKNLSNWCAVNIHKIQASYNKNIYRYTFEVDPEDFTRNILSGEN